MRPSVQGPTLESLLLTMPTQTRPANCLTEHTHLVIFLLPGAHTPPEQGLKNHSTRAPTRPAQLHLQTLGAPGSDLLLPLSWFSSVYSLLWAELCPHAPNSYAEVLPLVPQNVALFGATADVKSSDKVIRAALIQWDWRPDQRGTFGQRRWRRENATRMQRGQASEGTGSAGASIVLSASGPVRRETASEPLYRPSGVLREAAQGDVNTPSTIRRRPA